MSRPRTPTSILDAKGSYIKNPSRQNLNEPTTDHPIGNPPIEMSKEEKKYWKRLVKECLPGVLKESDRTMFALLVSLTTKFYLRQPMKAAEIGMMITLASRFAMTPSDRSRVSVEKPKTSSLADFISKKSA